MTATGKILARNRPSFSVVVIPGDLPEDKEGAPEGSGEAVVLDRLLALITGQRRSRQRPASAEAAPTVQPTPT
jgi:elongation factor P--beta-lysine ligase